MLTRFGDFDPTFTVFDHLRRRMDRLWEDFDAEWGGEPSFFGHTLGSFAWPRLNLTDAGATLVVTAEVPGLQEKDLEVTIHDKTLTLKGERTADVPKGYTVHRRERQSVKFARSLSLPVAVNAEKTNASLKDGVLTITLTKAPEAQPRQIAVKSAS